MEGRELGGYTSVLEQVAESCECGDEQHSSIKCCDFLTYHSD